MSIAVTARKKPPSGAEFADTASRGPSRSYLAGGLYRYCPKRPSLWRERDDPSRTVPDSCDSYRCDVCGYRKVQEMGRVISYSAQRATQSRFLTLTQAPATHAQRVTKMRNLRRSMTKRGLTWEHAWVAEVSDHGHLHVHAIQHGSYVPSDVLAASWGAHVKIRALSLQEVRGVASYMTKGFRTEMDSSLDLNGGRPLHTTAGFHHGLTKRGVLDEMRVNKDTGEVSIWDKEFVPGTH